MIQNWPGGRSLLPVVFVRLWVGGTSSKEPACQCRLTYDTSSVLGSGRSPGERHHNPLQYSCLENPMDGRAWHTAVHRVTKSRTRLKWLMDMSLGKLQELMIDREAWRAVIHGVAKSQIRLSDWTALKWLSIHACRSSILAEIMRLWLVKVLIAQLC